MKDKIGVKDEICFLLNGKPIQPQVEKKTICPVCGVDRASYPCGSSNKLRCPMEYKIDAK